MKKILFALFLLFTPLTFVFASEKVDLYLFYGNGCPHCKDLHEYVDSLKEDEEYKDLFEVKEYEVWYDKDNQKLMSSVAKEFNIEARGVPFYVVGDYYNIGFPNKEYSEDKYKEVTEELKDAIKKAYNNKNSEEDKYIDIVDKVNKDNIIPSNEREEEPTTAVVSNQNKENRAQSLLSTTKEDLIVVIVILVVLLVFVGYILKNNLQK